MACWQRRQIARVRGGIGRCLKLAEVKRLMLNVWTFDRAKIRKRGSFRPPPTQHSLVVRTS